MGATDAAYAMSLLPEDVFVPLGRSTSTDRLVLDLSVGSAALAITTRGFVSFRLAEGKNQRGESAKGRQFRPVGTVQYGTQADKIAHRMYKKRERDCWDGFCLFVDTQIKCSTKNPSECG